MIAALAWPLTAIAVIGAILNVLQDGVCFIAWMVANLGLAAINCRQRNWPQMTLFLVYFVLALWGFLSWQ